MKRKDCLAALLMCAAAGAVRFWDLAANSEVGTGFVTLGSVWVRYGVLALLVAGVFVLARVCGTKTEQGSLPVPAPLVFALTSAVALCVGVMLLNAAVREFVMPTTSFGGVQNGAGMRTLAFLLRLMCGVGFVLFCVWCLALCLRKAPLSSQRGAARTLGFCAMPAFLVLPVLRYAENPASVHRILYILPFCSALGALVFVIKLLGILCAPLTPERRSSTAAAGVCAFLLCTCIELPQRVWQLTDIGATALSLWTSVLLGLVGVLGAATALAVSEKQDKSKQRPPTGAKQGRRNEAKQ
ncbi:MAG: hypothetical protein RSD27_01270 [Ruthenibacterium sp.]